MGFDILGDDGAGNVDDSMIQINQEFARTFEHNKKREDLQRYEEFKKKGQISESDDSESSDDESDTDITNRNAKKDDARFFENLLKVRNRDPSLYQNAKLFQSDSDNDSENDDEQVVEKKEKKGKGAVFLKDVVARHLIEEGPDFDDEGMDYKEKKRMKTYNDEQEELKKEFLDAVTSVSEDDDDNGFLRVKERNNDVAESDDDGEFEKKLVEYFDEGELDEHQMFLKEYFKNKMWEDKRALGRDGALEDENLDDLVRDEEEIEKQEKYEEDFNFRYEENAGDRVMGHSRKVEGSVRKMENARKEQRKSKEERMKLAEKERKEELKHLKNLKKKEMEEKMKKVMDAAGIDFCPLDINDLEEDFSPEEHDKMMKKAFNEQYENLEDVDPDFGSDSDVGCDIEKPDFDKEDELLGLPKDWDVLDFGDGFQATRENILKLKTENAEDVGQEEEDNKERSEESKRKRKRKMSLVQKVKEEMMEEYYKLDYEDTIGDLKTRFKYAKVKPNKYGLETSEILALDEKDLNQYVSIKKIAPYREEEWKVPHSKTNKFKEALLAKSTDETDGKKNKLKDDSKKSDKASDSGQDGAKVSRNKKRKQRMRELKLGPLRLGLYKLKTNCLSCLMRLLNLQVVMGIQWFLP